MIGYTGRPASPVESQVDMMKSHVTRGAAMVARSDSGRTLRLAVPAGWTTRALCLDHYALYDESVGLNPGEAAARCAGCPVIAECLAAAMAEEHNLSAGNRYGVRGGLSPKERADLAFAESECPRGHTGRWGTQPGNKKPRCMACLHEDNREAHKARMASDPEFRARVNAKQRRRREERMVSCLECRLTMLGDSFPAHLSTAHGEAA